MLFGRHGNELAGTECEYMGIILHTLIEGLTIQHLLAFKWLVVII